MNEVMNICWKSILCNLTVSNIVIILVQSSIADGESFLVIFHAFLYLSEIILESFLWLDWLNQLYINNKFKFKLVTFCLASHLFNCCNCNLSLSYSGEATHQRCFIILAEISTYHLQLKCMGGHFFPGPSLHREYYRTL